jgi:hypothetical protein
LLEKTLGATRDLKAQIRSLDQAWEEVGIQLPPKTKQILDDALNNGSLLRRNAVSRYVQLLHQYVLPRDEAKNVEIPIVFTPPKLSDPELRAKCISAYRFLYQNHFKFIGKGRRCLLIEAIDDLRGALKEENYKGAKLAIDRARHLIKPINAYHLRNVNAGVAQSKYIKISGIGHPFIEYSISIENGDKNWFAENFHIGEDGRFKTDSIQLINGLNDVKLSPVGIPELLSDEKLLLAVSIKKHLAAYLRGLIDGPTKTNLAEVAVEEIILCSNPPCKNYSLRTTWNAFKACPICSHEGFYEHDHPKFELE